MKRLMEHVRRVASIFSKGKIALDAPALHTLESLLKTINTNPVDGKQFPLASSLHMDCHMQL